MNLPQGHYDVRVENPNGKVVVFPNAFTMMDPPRIDTVMPNPVCTEQHENLIVLNGEGFLRIANTLPTVMVGDFQAEVVETSGCTPLIGQTADLCTSLEIRLPVDSPGVGTHSVTVTNPSPAGCSSSIVPGLIVVNPPLVHGIVPIPVCLEQQERTLLVQGEDFLVLPDALPSVLLGTYAVNQVSVTLSSCSELDDMEGALTCSELEILLEEDSLPAGTYPVTVINPFPANCTSEPDGQPLLPVLEAPVITRVDPNPACLAQNDTVLTLTGTGFVLHDGQVPHVTIGNVSLSAVHLPQEHCVQVEGSSETLVCTELQGMLPAESLPSGTGSYPVILENPAPVGCQSTGMELEVAPPPEVLNITPSQICSGGGIFTVTGTSLHGMDAILIDPDGGIVESTSITVNEEGTSAQIAFASGLRTTTYNLHVTGVGGCSDMLLAAVTVNLGPVVYYMDPPATYSGIPIRGILYGSGFVTMPLSVSVAPSGGGEETLLTDIVWDPVRPNRIFATIPAGLEAGTYDVFIRGSDGCDSFLPEGLLVVSETTLALLEPAVSPPFGHSATPTPVHILAKQDTQLSAGEVNFLATPRVYVSNAELLTAEPLRAVVFDSSSQLSAIVPPIPVGTYDLVVINPGTPPTVGFSPGAYESVTVTPPEIHDVLPSKINKAIEQGVIITGLSFFHPEVRLECEDGTFPVAVVNLAESTPTRLVVQIDASEVYNGAVCVVRVTNTENQTWDEYFSLSVTTPAGNISPFRPSFSSNPEKVAHLNQGRRAPGLAVGRATRKARFLYAVGGDDGDYPGAMNTVEASSLGRFGEIGAWKQLTTTLPAGRTMATARTHGGFLYLLGGLDPTGLPTDDFLRARILDPLDVPHTNDVQLRYASLGNGLGQGTWTYMVSAVLGPMDPGNPAGETLPGEAVTIYAPAVPDGVEIELSWDTFFGADGMPAAEYRIYRNLHADEGMEQVRLLAIVPGTANPVHTFLDTNPAVFADENSRPLATGALGNWHLFGQLNTPRAAFGFVEVNEYSPDGQTLGCISYWYILGGITDFSDESSSYEVIDITGSLPGIPWEFESTGDLTARRDLGIWAASQGNSTALQLETCEFYLYAGSGAAGPLTGPVPVTTVRVARHTLAPMGELGPFEQAMQSGSLVNYHGYGSFWSGDRAYNIGGIQGGIITSNVMDGRWTAMTEPRIQNMTSSGNNLNESRYLSGFTRFGNVVYFVGGTNHLGFVLTSSEYNVR